MSSEGRSRDRSEGPRKEKSRIPWDELRREYESTPGLTKRALACKHGVSPQAVSAHARREGWGQAGALAGEAPELRSQRLRLVADLLMEQVAEAARDESLNAAGLRQLTGALRDIKEIQGLKSALDVQEQAARIERLRREARREEGGSILEITMDDWTGDFSL